MTTLYGQLKSTWKDRYPHPRIKGAAVLTGITLFDQVKEVKTRDVEKTGSDVSREEVGGGSLEAAKKTTFY